MTWYKEWFGEDYLKVYPHRDESEARRQVEQVGQMLPLSPDARLLDLGCGSGRHAIELCRRGYWITCLDLSSVLLNLARRKAREVGCRIRPVQADMRAIPLHRAFDAVVSFFTTFGYFDSDSENLRTLKSIEQALKPDGWFLQDYLNKTQVIADLVPRNCQRHDGYEVVQERQYDRQRERIEKKITLTENGDVREYYESVRLYTIDEMRALLQKAGLTLERTFGAFDGTPFNEESPRLILVGRRQSR